MKEQKPFLNKRAFHLAGIVPIAKQPYDFNLPWDDCLLSIGKNFLAIEKAIVECAYAGCETIWIVCHKSMQPLIKQWIGERIDDPISTNTMSRYPSRVLKQIQLYYVPVHPKNYKRRDCLSHSILYGALSAFLVSAKISKWILPDKYFVSFPWGIHDYDKVHKYRKEISSEKNFCFSYNGKTIRDGLMASFSFGPEDYFVARDKFKELEKNYYFHREDHSKIKFNFSLDKIFKSCIIDIESELKEFYQIASWEAYQDYIRSDFFLEIKRPKFLKVSHWNKIKYYEEGEDEPGEKI